MFDYTRHDSGYFSRRSGTLFLVATLHALLLYVLITALLPAPAPKLPDPLQYQLLKNTPPRELPLLLPEPQFNHVTIEAPPPDFTAPPEVDTSHEVTAEFGHEPSLPYSPPSPPHLVKQVQGGPGAGFPNPDDFYPTLARHMEEQGVATIRVCVDVNGRLNAEPITLQGSGSSRLDEGAIKLAKAGSGHYRATTEDGRPVNSCYPFRIRFQLKN